MQELMTTELGRIKLGVERAKLLAKALNIHPVVILFSDYDHDPSGKYYCEISQACSPHTLRMD